MRLRDPRVWIAVLSSLGVLYLALGNMGRKSPGPLTSVHARADLEQSCADCHGGWLSTMPEACLDCHEPIADQIEGGSGLHGHIGADRAQVCAMCHSEHHGPDFGMVNRQSFALAGVPDPAEFDHNIVGFDLGGAHLDLACTECHVNADVPVLPEGEPRYLGLDRSCASCHDDPHEGRMVVGCADCHSQVDFTELAAPRHAAHLALVGGHGDVACTTCHQESSAHSLDAVGAVRAPGVRQCVACHESPHEAQFIKGVAVLGSQPEGASCITCHEPEHISFREEGLVISAEQHACSGFALVEPHHEVECASCHAPESDAFGERYPGRHRDSCGACHDDPHAGQFETGARGARGCVECHDRLEFSPHTFSVEKHRDTGLALAGSHLELECHACHQEPSGVSSRVFRGTPAQCQSCHDDAHLGFFDPHADQLASSTAGTCAQCHFATQFADVPEDQFDHAHWTGFAVRGAHAQASCESCHPRAAAPDETGRAFGRVAEHFGVYHGCATCHTDPHQGAFDTPQHPQNIDGRVGCARCHVEQSFRAFPDGFDHLRWTGFALQGAHTQAECSDCHVPLRRPDANGLTWGAARGRTCADCHDDPHAGQFEVVGKTDCARCHRSASTFGETSFVHDIQSRFRLGEAHQDLECSACHKPHTTNGIEVVRYRPLGRNCVDCHGEQHNPLRKRGGG